MQNNASREITITYHIAQLILYILGVNCILSMFLFHVDISIDWYSLPISIVIALLLWVMFYAENISKKTIFEIIIAFILIISTCFAAIYFYDLSYDGNFYHKFAVGLLRYGWNPIKEPAENFCMQFFDQNFGTDAYIWIDSYCKQPWTFAASLYALTGNIEVGKSYTLLSMIIVFCIAYSYLRDKNYSRWQCMVICLIIAVNPIAIAQMDTYYIDGYLFNMLFSLIFLLMMNMDRYFLFNSSSTASLIACAMCICANIKFTGLLYGGIYCIAYFIFWAICQYVNSQRAGLRRIAKRFGWFVMLAIFCILGAGYSPYITNLFRHGSMTYPLTGHGAVDIMTINTPDILKNISPVKQLLYSLFSKMDNMVADSKGSLFKLPFTISNEEFQNLSQPDTRMGGFGMLFSGILLICIAIFAYYFVIKKMEKKVLLFCTMNVILSVVLCLAISESWWARYAPYVYFLVIVALIVLCSPTISAYVLQGRYSKFAGKGLSIVLMCLCLINNGMFFPAENEIKTGEKINFEISALQGIDKVHIDFSGFPGRVFNYLDQSVPLVIDETISDNPQKMMSGFGGVYYLIEEE